MDRSLENLCELIDSGKEENLELALQVSVNLPKEFEWLHKYLRSFKRLPSNFTSWYHLYSEVVGYRLETVCVVEHYRVSSTLRLPKFPEHRFHMSEITENVANELHYKLFRMEHPQLRADLEEVEDSMFRLKGFTDTNNTCVNIAKWAINLRERRDTCKIR